MLEGLRGRLKWLDPFTYVDLYLMPMVNPKGDKLVENIVYVVSALAFVIATIARITTMSRAPATTTATKGERPKMV